MNHRTPSCRSRIACWCGESLRTFGDQKRQKGKVTCAGQGGTRGTEKHTVGQTQFPSPQKEGETELVLHTTVRTRWSVQAPSCEGRPRVSRSGLFTKKKKKKSYHYEHQRIDSYGACVFMCFQFSWANSQEGSSWRASSWILGFI